MNQGRTVFAQLMDELPKYEFDKCVRRYAGNKHVRTLPTYEHFLVLAFAQLTYRESLRDIETCLRALGPKLYHSGIGQPTARSTLADANETRDWRIFSDFAHVLIEQASQLYADEPFGAELEQAAYALDSTTIDLCLSLFPWAKFRRRKAAIKLHTLLALRGNFPTVVILTTGKVHDVNILDELTYEPGSFYIADRGYLDFARLYRLHLSGAFFVTRAKKNSRFQRRYSRPVDKTTGLRFDQTVVLSGFYSRQEYPEAVAPHRLSRSPNRQGAGVPDQQLHRTGADDCPTLSLPLAGRTVLQMDQTAFAYQSLLRHFRECGAHPSLDRHLRICPGGHRQKAAVPLGQPLHHSTDFEPFAFRENAHFTGSFSTNTSHPICLTITISPVYRGF